MGNPARIVSQLLADDFFCFNFQTSFQKGSCPCTKDFCSTARDLCADDPERMIDQPLCVSMQPVSGTVAGQKIHSGRNDLFIMMVQS